jgi:hypothetical protein
MFRAMYLADRNQLMAVVAKLKLNLKRYPDDEDDILACFQMIGQSNAALVGTVLIDDQEDLMSSFRVACSIQS